MNHRTPPEIKKACKHQRIPIATAGIGLEVVAIEQIKWKSHVPVSPLLEDPGSNPLANLNLAPCAHAPLGGSDVGRGSR
eukprot:6188769-Pleurochrysis_carterae.AAC.5